MQVEFTENLEFALVLFIKEMIPPFLTDVFIITVTLHRFEPVVLPLRSFKNKELPYTLPFPLSHLYDGTKKAITKFCTESIVATIARN